MTKQIVQLIIMASMGIGISAWGIYGIVNKNKIKNRGDYILSVGQVLGGITILVFVILWAVFRLQH
jgi:hypothetical protein